MLRLFVGVGADTRGLQVSRPLWALCRAVSSCGMPDAWPESPQPLSSLQRLVAIPGGPLFQLPHLTCFPRRQPTQ